MIQNLSGNVPMISRPVPALGSSAASRTRAGARRDQQQSREQEAKRFTRDEHAQASYGNTRSILRQSFCAAAQLLVQRARD